mmetsp:Transcript_20466/g.44490  ORF Transcript_20466/g.44490 Transcript_20466/m.44490 type:complete len:96 (-) Transcript_20466:1611-1898(-)
MDDFESKIEDCILRMHTEHASDAARRSSRVTSRFSLCKTSFELDYTSLSDFKNGLEGIIGLPVVNFMLGMEEDHHIHHSLNIESSLQTITVSPPP